MPHIKQWVRLFLAGFCAFGVSAAVVSCSSDNGASPTPGVGGSTGTAGVSAGGSAGTATGGGSQCATGTSSCSGACVNLTMDALNCGVCGKACSAGQVCSGTCMCQAGLTACPSGCANIAADGANCGACGMACPGTAPYCSGSACVATCPADKAQCGTGCVDPATFQTDALNCGTCGKQCAAGQTCTAGACSCPIGQTACGGACVDLNSDVNHCGSCEKACAMGAACATGMCQGGGMGGSGGGGGTGGGGNRPTNCPAAPSLLSDFEEGSGVLVKQGGRDGWWYVYADMTTGMQTPASSNMAIAASLLQPAEGDCNKYALHSTATGHPQYVGFGATLSPGTSASTKKAVSLEQYTGVSFRVRSGAGTQPPIWFEFLNKETQPADLSGTATGDQVDAYNTRGRLLDGIGTEWKTYTVPFSTLAPRYLPSDCAAGLKCEAPAFNSKSTLGLQFSLYDQFNTSGKYDLWVDDVNLTTGDAGLPTLTGTGTYPFPRDAAVANGCTKPTGASGKLLVEAFQNWKKAFVTNDQGNLRVKSPEIDNGATVSEGIAYGMLIAVFMNDRTLFDGLWAYWKAHPASGLLMTWKIPGGSGSASDADEDAAFALIQASKQWGGSYLTDAKSLLSQIASSEVEAGSYVLKPGNQFGGSDITNPSYFAPAYYRVFASVDTGNATLWNGAVTSTYKLLNSIEGSNGLVPAWCQSNCTTRGGGGYKDADKYQYDSHRTPWRMALDVCWNNNADAKDYVNKVTTFFVGQSDTEGLGALVDLYEGGGTACSGCSSPAKSNSMSIIGTAAVGAMATGNAAHKAFLDRAWQFILDANYTADPTFKEGGYTYYNATVGLLTALTLSGNFNNF